MPLPKSPLPEPLNQVLDECQGKLSDQRGPHVLCCQGELIGVGVTTLLKAVAQNPKNSQVEPVYLDWADKRSQYETFDGLRNNVLSALTSPHVLLLDHIPWGINNDYARAMGKWLQQFLAQGGGLVYGCVRFWNPGREWPSFRPEDVITVPLLQQKTGERIPWALAQALKAKGGDELKALCDYLEQWKAWEQRNFPQILPLSQRLETWCGQRGKISAWEWPPPWGEQIAPQTDFHPALKPWMEKACEYRLWERLKEGSNV